MREDLVERGQAFYDEKLREELEPEHTGRYVAIEPESGRYFLDDTGSGAINAALAEMPEGHFYVARVGYRSAEDIGGDARRIGYCRRHGGGAHPRQAGGRRRDQVSRGHRIYGRARVATRLRYEQRAARGSEREIYDRGGARDRGRHRGGGSRVARRDADPEGDCERDER